MKLSLKDIDTERRINLVICSLIVFLSKSVTNLIHKLWVTNGTTQIVQQE